VQQAASGRRGTRLASRETAAVPDREKPQTGLVEKARAQIQPVPDEEDQPAEDEVPDAGAVAAEKPATLREAAEKMNLSILVYDEAKTGRLVFIDGRKYVEGDSINGLYLIESITPDGAVLSHKGEKVLLAPGSK
jgi:general secretion pathway protein B